MGFFIKLKCSLLKKTILPFDFSDGNYGVRPIMPYGFEDGPTSTNKSFNELLEKAVEDEDYEEAARLRDWNKGLTDLLLSLKDVMLDAVRNDDLGRLDDCLKEMSDYRRKLIKK